MTQRRTQVWHSGLTQQPLVEVGGTTLSRHLPSESHLSAPLQVLLGLWAPQTPLTFLGAKPHLLATHVVSAHAASLSDGSVHSVARVQQSAFLSIEQTPVTSLQEGTSQGPGAGQSLSLVHWQSSWETLTMASHTFLVGHLLLSL